MRKIDLGQAINTAANAGVIVSIVFLALELNSTNRAVTGAAYQARALAIMERQDRLAQSQFLLGTIVKIENDGWSALSELEQNSLNNTALGVMYRLDATDFQCELGILESQYCDNVFVGEMRLWVPRWRDQGILDEWMERGLVRPSFAAKIEQYMSEPRVFDP